MFPFYLILILDSSMIIKYANNVYIACMIAVLSSVTIPITILILPNLNRENKAIHPYPSVEDEKK